MQEQREVARPGEDRDRAERDGEVDEREHTGRRSEREVEAAPQQRDRQDQHGHEHEEGLADARFLVVSAVCADVGQTRERGLEERPGRAHGPRIHTGRDGFETKSSPPGDLARPKGVERADATNIPIPIGHPPIG